MWGRAARLTVAILEGLRGAGILWLEDIRRMRILSLLSALTMGGWAQSPIHPLDGLTTAEYWTVYDTLRAAGHLAPDTLFASVLLHPPAKSSVIAWQPGQPLRREADVVLLRGGKSFTAVV